jgi:hypothetical protein
MLGARSKSFAMIPFEWLAGCCLVAAWFATARHDQIAWVIREMRLVCAGGLPKTRPVPGTRPLWLRRWRWAG